MTEGASDALPELRGEMLRDDGSVVLDLFVPAELSFFAGHFPGFAILPGVVQVHWAVHYGRRRFAIGGAFSRLVNIKFQKRVSPDSDLQLALSYEPARRQLSFAYRSSAGCHASGRVEFLDTEAGASIAEDAEIA